MKLCRQCGRSPLPFVMVFFVAGVSAYLTWLTLSYSDFERIEVVAGSGIVFLAVAGAVLHYVLSCMRRHCRHRNQSEHSQGAAH